MPHIYGCSTEYTMRERETYYYGDTDEPIMCVKSLSFLVLWEEPTAYLGPYTIPTAAPHWEAPCAARKLYMQIQAAKSRLLKFLHLCHSRELIFSLYEFSQYNKTDKNTQIWHSKYANTPSTVGTTDTLSQRDDNGTRAKHKIYEEKTKSKNFAFVKSNEKFSHDYSFLGSIFSSVVCIYICIYI